MAKNPAVAAIEYALSTDSDGMAFLRCWMHGEFPEIREEWPDAPEEVFIGADPLHPQTKAGLEQDIELAELIRQAQRHMTRTKEADAVSVAMTQFLMRMGA